LENFCFFFVLVLSFFNRGSDFHITSVFSPFIMNIAPSSNPAVSEVYPDIVYATDADVAAGRASKATGSFLDDVTVRSLLEISGRTGGFRPIANASYGNPRIVGNIKGALVILTEGRSICQIINRHKKISPLLQAVLTAVTFEMDVNSRPMRRLDATSISKLNDGLTRYMTETIELMALIQTIVTFIEVGGVFLADESFMTGNNNWKDWDDNDEWGRGGSNGLCGTSIRVHTRD
jgi:hypothetical protein